MTPNEFVYWYDFHGAVEVVTWAVLVAAAASLVIFILAWDNGLPKWVVPLFSAIIIALVAWKVLGLTGSGYFQRNAPPELRRRVAEWTVLKRAIHTGPGSYQDGYDRDYVIANWLAGIPEPVVWRGAGEEHAPSR